MAARALVPYRHYVIGRWRNGRWTTVVYTGAIRNKPKGWKVVRKL